MRMSRFFYQTLREAPAEASLPGYALLLRAGYIRPLASGIFTYLPLAQRVLSRIEAIIREEMDAIGGQEMTMPVVHPAEIWQETGRWYDIGSEMSRFKDRGDRDMVLAMTHEEVVADLVRREIRSYKQLPALIYQIQTKWRDEPRPRGGLIRVREFTMKDSYSLDIDEAGLDAQYRAHYQAYFNIYHRCGLDVVAVASDTGMMGGKLAHEYMYITPIGEDTLLIDETGEYAANREIARFYKEVPPAEDAMPIERVATPGTSTIEALATFLGVPASHTAKAVFMMARRRQGEEVIDQFVFAVLRGDMELNEIKLGNAIGALALRPATEDEIRAIGAEPGYASPLGVHDCLIVVDDIIPQSPNLVAGANEHGYHLRNVNYDRDYTADIVADIAAARDGDRTPDGSTVLKAVRGVEVGNIFKLGTRYTEAMGATFLDEEGKSRPVVMGSYGIGVGRLMGCLAEAYHDDSGLIWPVCVAPYPVHLVALKGGETAADQIEADLQAAGIDVLYDDRDERPGVKFNDADLLGMPLRLTVGARSLEKGGVECRRRDNGEQSMLPLDGVVAAVQAELAAMQQTLNDRVVEVPYRI